jgi:hypothetical protein
MKNLFVLLIVVFCIASLTSCASSPYKKRKGCRGNGGWYGNRNLGAVEQQKNHQNIYVLAPTTEIEASY